MSITDKKSLVNVSLENIFESREEITGFTSMSEFSIIDVQVSELPLDSIVQKIYQGASS